VRKGEIVRVTGQLGKEETVGNTGSGTGKGAKGKEKTATAGPGQEQEL